MKEMSREKLEELKENYRQQESKLTHKQKAALESEIWKLLRYLEGPGLTKSGFERRDWFQKEFKGKASEYEIRATLWNAGAATDEIWERIDSGRMSISQARFTLSQSKNIAAAKRIPLNDAISKVLYAEDTGKVEVEARYIEEIKDSTGNPTKFAQRVKDLAESFIDVRLKEIEVDEFHAHDVKEEFMWAIDDAVQTLGSRLNSIRTNHKRHKLAQIGKNIFENAALKLGINARWKKPLDPIKVRKAAKSRKRELHPDRNKSDKAQDEFIAVKEAEELLLDYCRLYKEESK